MVLVDTSVWIDHFRKSNALLVSCLRNEEVLCHSFVVGEVACGNLKHRENVLNYLNNLPHALNATHEEILHFISGNKLFGLGIGLIDAHLLASTKLAHAKLWTKDKKLAMVAEKCKILFTKKI